MIKSKEWFFEWFDSPYYHLLYQHRNEEEARLFISKLTAKLEVNHRHKILDLACGKGRHSIYLNKLGYEVMGVDLAKTNIAHANWFANDRLKFRVHDMRYVVKEGYFDVVINLFTSFGYFEDEADNERSIVAAAGNLKKGGKFIIDFFNTPQLLANLVPSETTTIGGVTFKISREYTDGYIIKNISFDDGNDFFFQEKVKAITQEDFRNYFALAGLEVTDMLGSYQLTPYDEQNSERMIFITQKI
jgi:SAM-dependent methyltransferase